IEIGNAPRNPIQLGSYEKPGPLLSASIVPTRRCSKYTGRLAIRLLPLFEKIGQFGSRRTPRWSGGSGNLSRPEPQSLSHQQASSKLTGGLASFQVDQKSSANAGRQGELALAHFQ